VYFTVTNETIGKLLPGLPEFVRDLNIGSAALLLNVVVMLAVSAVTARAYATANNPAE
jgi:SSS family solute:Na+ symporter